MIAAVQDDLVRRHRMTVQDYHRMAEVGLFAPDAHGHRLPAPGSLP
jgi:hypothetical protein